MGLSLPAVERMADIALVSGIRHSETTGPLRKYLDRLYLEHGNGNNSRIYAETVFIFNKETLITVLKLPNEFKRAVLKIKVRKAEGVKV
jgi:hypothetical protein